MLPVIVWAPIYSPLYIAAVAITFGLEFDVFGMVHYPSLLRTTRCFEVTFLSFVRVIRPTEAAQW